MSEHDSDAEPTTTAERAESRARRKEQTLKKEQEILSLRKMVASLQQQHAVDRGIMESMEHEMVQSQLEHKHAAPSVAASAHGAGNAGAGHGPAHVSHGTSDEEDDDDVSHHSVDDGRVRGRKQVDNGPIVLPRIPKSLQTFSGEGGSSVRSWLQQYETIRMPLQWDDRVSIAVAAMQLTDRAQQWYQEEGIKKPASSSWKSFKSALLRRFTPVVNQLFIPKYTRNISQRSGEKAVDFMDRVRVALRDLGVDDEEQVVRVFSSGLHDWIMEPLTMVVGDDHKISAKELLDHCIRIELSKSIRHGTHFDAPHRAHGGNPPAVPVDRAHRGRGFVPIHGYARQGGMVTSYEKLQLNRNDSCKICGQKGHWARECPNRGGANAGPANARPGGVNVAVNVGGGKTCSHCGKPGHLVDQCYTLKNQQRRDEAAYPNRVGGVVPPGRAAIRSVSQDGRVEQHSVCMIGLVQPHVAGVFICQGALDGITVVCTMDTGADHVSCLSEETFLRLDPEIQRRCISTAEQALVSAGGHQLTVMGVCTLRLRLKSNGGTKETDVYFHIVRGLNVQCLLGSTFLLECGNSLNWWDPQKAYFELWTGDRVPLTLRTTYKGKAGVGPGITITSIMRTQREVEQYKRNMKKKIVTDIEKVAQLFEATTDVCNNEVVKHVAVQQRLDGEMHCEPQMPPISAAPGTVPGRMSIRLIRNVTIPAQSAMVVPYAKAYAGKLPVGSVFMTQGNEKLYGDGVMVARSTHQVSQDKDTKLVLQVTNTTSRPISYRRGQIVGTAEEVDLMSLKEKEEIHKVWMCDPTSYNRSKRRYKRSQMTLL